MVWIGGLDSDLLGHDWLLQLFVGNVLCHFPRFETGGFHRPKSFGSSQGAFLSWDILLASLNLNRRRLLPLGIYDTQPLGSQNDALLGYFDKELPQETLALRRSPRRLFLFLFLPR